MAVNWIYVGMLEERGLLRPGSRVLDVGSSNLYSAPADGIRSLLSRYNPAMPPADADRLAERLSAGSYVDPVHGATNQAFVGELFEAIGMEYVSFDIASGYKTEILDFNQQSLPERHRNRYDLVLNFGTTEHILHQYNSFKIIHEATRPTGVMWHQIPSIGFVDHCYFSYKPRFFFEVAGYNGYELIAYWYTVGGQSRLLDTVLDYASYFPVLREYVENPGSRPQPVDNFTIPNVCANALYRKLNDGPFMGTIERSTSVGEVPDSVMHAYAKESTETPREHSTIAARARQSIRQTLKPFLKPLRKRILGW